MSVKNNNNSARQIRHTTMASIVNTFEWIIISLILALTFRTFILEAFRIPTGSMAPTLRGDHFELACSQCGHEFDYGFLPREYRSKGDLYTINPNTRCPNCGLKSRPIAPKANGDRIFVFKGSYYFTDPQRWDVFVFKNPTQPRINYIKRVVGKPGEKIEIVDGDIFINDEIARKPSKVQKELWMEIYKNDLQPIDSFAGSFNGHAWRQPFENVEGSNWDLTKNNSRTFELNSVSDEIETIYYNSESGNDFKTTYGYNPTISYSLKPNCSDLLIEFNVSCEEMKRLGSKLRKYGRDYIAEIKGNKMELSVEYENEKKLLAELPIQEPPQNKPVAFAFANIDHMLVFNFGPYELKFDLGKTRDAMGSKLDGTKPRVEIFGNGKIQIDNTALYRDIHYISDGRNYGGQDVRAGEGSPFMLGENEFFACGDNSPQSSDSRLWSHQGLGNNGKRYPMGVVPRDYLVGKAFFVYWPSGIKPTLNPKFSKFKILNLPLIPNISKMKLIHGGDE